MWRRDREASLVSRLRSRFDFFQPGLDRSAFPRSGVGGVKLTHVSDRIASLAMDVV